MCEKRFLVGAVLVMGVLCRLFELSVVDFEQGIISVNIITTHLFAQKVRRTYIERGYNEVKREDVKRFELDRRYTACN